ncbi:unnamed protein product [Porites lobata]|uniref:Uncharacterized protein n=1 Tax=Porites lobata TaxID=104759 RepID=A0ABN8MRL9_9CNID|nr:unnamed protein product [Porites lobata]
MPVSFWTCRSKMSRNKISSNPTRSLPRPNFFCEDINGQCKLKRTHAYFAQVQGQMGVSGASWCDFIVYRKKGISVERIPFDPAYWETLKLKLHTYYFNHFIKTAATEFAK